MTGLAIAEALSLPVEFATEASAVLARRGRGKTYAASVIAEELAEAGQPFVVLDPVGVWWGLRSSADGRHDGLDVTILGGEHGDLPLEATSGTRIATFVVDNPAAYILDLSSFESKGQQDRFVSDFAERLYRYKAAAERRTPITLIIDEADQFAPQKPRQDERGGYAQRMLGALEAIVRLGRARGLGCVLITQRPAVLNKNVLTQAGALILLGITGPQDRKAIDDWVSGHADAVQRAEVIGSLAGLGVGEAWVWWPTEELLARVQIRRRRTFDSSSTPKAGERAREAVRFATVDLDALKEAIAESVERAQAEDPKVLQSRIRDLERQLRERPTEAVVETVTETVEIPAVSDEMRAYLAETFAQVGTLADEMRASADVLGGRASSVLDALNTRPAAPATRPVKQTGQARSSGFRPSTEEAKPVTPQVKATVPAGELGLGETRILIAAAQYPGGVTKEQLTVMTAYKRSSRDTYLQRLRARDLVTVTGGLVIATDAGIDALGDDYEPLPTGDALLAYWLDKLGDAGEGRILAALAEAYPAGISRDELSDMTDYKRSSRDTYLQRLRARQLVTTDGDPRAADVLFGA